MSKVSKKLTQGQANALKEFAKAFNACGCAHDIVEDLLGNYEGKPCGFDLALNRVNSSLALINEAIRNLGVEAEELGGAY
jgi:hypothetical protein